MGEGQEGDGDGRSGKLGKGRGQHSRGVKSETNVRLNPSGGCKEHVAGQERSVSQSKVISPYRFLQGHSGQELDWPSRYQSGNFEWTMGH